MNSWAICPPHGRVRTRTPLAERRFPFKSIYCPHIPCASAARRLRVGCASAARRLRAGCRTSSRTLPEGRCWIKKYAVLQLQMNSWAICPPHGRVRTRTPLAARRFPFKSIYCPHIPCASAARRLRVGCAPAAGPPREPSPRAGVGSKSMQFYSFR